jgi:hypothetical protein
MSVTLTLTSKNEFLQTILINKLQTKTMIKKIIFLLFIAFTLSTNAQSSKCNAARVGIFELDSGSEYGVTRIERDKRTQIETNEHMGFKATYDVVWIDPCHYELRNMKVIKGDSMHEAKPTDTVKVEILNVEGAKIFLRLSSNFSTFVTDCEMEKIK